MNESELLAAILEALEHQADEDDAMTMPEFNAAWPFGENKTRALVTAAVRAGILEPCRVRRPTIVGTLMTVWAYRPTKKAPGAASHGAEG